MRRMTFKWRVLPALGKDDLLFGSVFQGVIDDAERHASVEGTFVRICAVKNAKKVDKARVLPFRGAAKA